MSTNKDVDFAGFNVIIEFGEAGFFVVVAIKTGDFGFGEEAGEFDSRSLVPKPLWMMPG